MLVRIASWTVLLHLIQILVWALFYAWRGAMPDLTTSAYFSAVTYTTTGYGDLVLPPEWRLVGGVEALTGILMCGLSTGLFFAVFTDIFGLNRRVLRRDAMIRTVVFDTKSYDRDSLQRAASSGSRSSGASWIGGSRPRPPRRRMARGRSAFS